MLLAKFGEGLSVTLIGLAVVFLGLIIIILMIMLFSKILKSFAKKNEKPAAAPAPAPAPAPVVEEEETSDDTELVAVITAALSAYLANEETATDGRKLVVRRIRKVNSWNNTAREEQVYRF